jgi:hypothetical protein
MTRPMTPAEKQRFHGYFSNLNADAVVVTGEVDRAYNCISWTVGVTNRWLWPGSTIRQFDTFYRGFGFIRAGNGPIAAWGQSTSNMTHGSISGPGHGLRWESKCGSDLRIEHALNELVGASYGRVLAFYAHSLALAAPAARLIAEEPREIDSVFPMNAEHNEALRKATAEVSREVRETFKEAFAAWKRSWFEGGLAISSDPHSRAVGREFDTLVALGPSILPLVVEALAEPDNFIALQLYDAIQPDQKLVVQFEPDDQRILEGEQGRARHVVQHWLSNR